MSVLAALVAVPLPAPAGAATNPNCGRPIGVTVDSDGDTHYRYRLPNGLITEHLVAGPTYDPSTASTQRLRKLGLGDRPPAATPESADWHSAAAALKRPMAPKAACVRPDLRATVLSYGFSGYRAQAPSGNVYSAARSSYTAPNFYLSTCVNESMSQWVGISDGNTLVQAGVYVDQFTGTVRAGSFYEVIKGTLDTGGLVDMGLAYVEGHRYFFSVSSADAVSWTFLVNDLTRGTYVSSLLVGSGAGAQYRKQYAFFMSERLTRGDGQGNFLYTQYMNHSLVRFRSARMQIYGGGQVMLAQQSPEPYRMRSFDGTILGNAHSLDPATSNFSENRAACGDVDRF